MVNVQSIREWYSENAPEQSITEEYIGSERIEGKTESADKKKSEVQYVLVTKTAVIKVPVDIGCRITSTHVENTLNDPQYISIAQSK